MGMYRIIPLLEKSPYSAMYMSGMSETGAMKKYLEALRIPYHGLQKLTPSVNMKLLNKGYDPGVIASSLLTGLAFRVVDTEAGDMAGGVVIRVLRTEKERWRLNY